MNDFDISHIRRAAERLRGRVVRTPLLESPILNERAACRLFVKAEEDRNFKRPVLREDRNFKRPVLRASRSELGCG